MRSSEKFMRQALALAKKALSASEVPVGAVVVDPDGKIIGSGYNLNRTSCDPTAHAEIVALRAACQTLNSSRLDGCSLYVTLEPCAMCAAAIATARIAHLYFAALDPKQGAVAHGVRYFQSPSCLHSPYVHDGCLADLSLDLLKSFFTSRR